MDPSDKYGIADVMCSLCRTVPWSELPPEEYPAWPHHTSRASLEASAKTCLMCEYILDAALSHLRESNGSRQGKGYWRSYVNVDYQEAGSTRKVMFVEERAANLAKISSQPSAGVIAPTGKITTSDGNKSLPHNPVDALRMESLSIEDATEGKKVFVYGNWWKQMPGDRSDMFMIGIGARFASTKSIHDAPGSNQNTINFRGSGIRVCSSDVGPLANQIPGRIREPDSSSPKALKQLFNWLDVCDLRHPCSARQAPLLPTRVLDVQALTSGVKLIESWVMTGQYVALSHSWGTSRRLMLTKATYADMTQNIPVSYLPKTFQDAIALTRAIKIRYLWIDCLCIIQDDPKDWESEAATMGEVYSKAYLTISAADSTDSFAGCFPERGKAPYVSTDSISMGYNTKRNPNRPHTFHIGMTDSNSPGVVGTMSLFREWMPGASINWVRPYIVGAYGGLFDPILSENIGTRAWTLQERLLSPRIIHYGKDQMYWECRAYTRSEDGALFRPMAQMSEVISKQKISLKEHGYGNLAGLSLIEGINPANGDPPRWANGWLCHMQDFSRRKLTHEQDKLPALSGLAQVIAAATNDTYHAGMWANHLLEDLNWRVYPQEETVAATWPTHTLSKGKLYGEVRRTQAYRAPSWSWASLEAPIKFVPMSFNHLVGDWIEVSTTPAGQDSCGKVANGFLKLNAPLFPIRTHRPKKWNKHGSPVEISIGEDQLLSIGEAFFDFEPNDSTYPCFAAFLDAANALIVRAYNPELDHKSVDTPTRRPRVITSRNPETKDQGQTKLVSLAEYIALGPSSTKTPNDQKYRISEKMTRIGIASFVRPRKEGDVNFGESERTEEEDAKEAADIASGSKKPEYWSDEDFKKKVLPNVVSSGGTWGPITTDVGRVEITIV